MKTALAILLLATGALAQTASIAGNTSATTMPSPSPAKQYIEVGNPQDVSHPCSPTLPASTSSDPAACKMLQENYAAVQKSYVTGYVDVITTSPCGWNGVLADGKCKATFIVTFPKEYEPVTCTIKPKEAGNEQVLECTWEPPKKARP